MIYSRPVRIILGILCFALIFWYLSRWYNNSVMSFSVGAAQVSESAEPDAAEPDAAAVPEEAETPAEPEPTPTPEPERPEVLKAAELGLPAPPEIDISQWQYVLVNGDHPLDPYDYEPAELAYLNMTGDDTEWDANTNTALTTITNSREKVILKKTDEITGQTIEGAVFELFQGREKLYLDADNLILTRAQVEAIIGMDITSDAAAEAMEQNGISSTITIGEAELVGVILDQEYKLSEVSAPAGYVIKNKDITFTLTKTGDGREISVEGANASAEGIMITITNPPGAELPMTGGSGTLPYTFGGLAMIMASALMYGFRMRRGERRLN